MTQIIRDGWLWQFELMFKPDFVFVGIHWKTFPQALECYVCLLPMLPLRVYCQRMKA